MMEERYGDADQQKEETRNDDAQEHAVTGATSGSEISQHFLTLKNSQRNAMNAMFQVGPIWTIPSTRPDYSFFALP